MARIFNAEQIYRLVWNESSPVDLRMVPVHISNLRKRSNRILPAPDIS
ncbi:winged helix-turn-helix domain-containing protein [Pelotomaculum terephthalicicum]